MWSGFEPAVTVLKSRSMTALSHKFCVAPMMEWTDRHCRYFMRLISKRALLYTEMVTAEAVIYGDRVRVLGFDPAEQPRPGDRIKVVVLG